MNDFERFVDGTIAHILLWNNTASEVNLRIENNIKSNVDFEKTHYLLRSQKFQEFFKNQFGFILLSEQF